MASSPTIPHLIFGSGSQKIPVLGFGTATNPPVVPEITKAAILEAIQLGYRHFDTAPIYFTNQYVGEAVAEAINRGLILSRDDLFITSKLWCTDAHPHLVIPALKTNLLDLGLEYVDLYLIHYPVSAKPGKMDFPKEEDILPLEYESVWAAMEECQKLGLTKAVGVSNFSIKKLQELLHVAKIHRPAVNQVEVNPCWQQKKLIEFCEDNGILVVGYSPLGAAGTVWGANTVIESDVLKEIAKSKDKTVAQVCLRWAYEQGIGIVAKSFNKERMKQNMDIFDWSLSNEEIEEISRIPQARSCPAMGFISPYSPFNTLEQLWDDAS